MITAQQIDAMPIEKVKLDFAALMGTIVKEQGDDRKETDKKIEETTNAK